MSGMVVLTNYRLLFGYNLGEFIIYGRFCCFEPPSDRGQPEVRTQATALISCPNTPHCCGLGPKGLGFRDQALEFKLPTGKVQILYPSFCTAAATVENLFAPERTSFRSKPQTFIAQSAALKPSILLTPDTAPTSSEMQRTQYMLITPNPNIVPASTK